jgi:hypothetical protein
MLPTHSMTITLFIELENASRSGSNYEHTKTPNLIYLFLLDIISETVMSATTLRSECPQSCCNHMRPIFDVTPNLKKGTSFHYSCTTECQAASCGHKPLVHCLVEHDTLGGFDYLVRIIGDLKCHLCDY